MMRLWMTKGQSERFHLASWWVKRHGTAKAALRHILEAEERVEVTADAVRDLAVLAYAEDQGWKVRQPDLSTTGRAS